MKTIKLLICSILIFSTVQAYHILVLSPVPTKSHNALGKGIVDALLRAGHEVTWATPYIPKAVKNLNIIDVSATLPITAALNMSDHAQPKGMGFVQDFTKNISSKAINTPALRDALINNQYDAVVTEWFFSDYDAGYAAIQQVPWIVFTSFIMDPYVEELVDEVRSVSCIPAMMNDSPTPMNLWQRIKNTLMYITMRSMIWYYTSGSQEFYDSLFSQLANARGVPLPPFSTALNNISVLFVNGHPSFAPAQSLPPNVVQIAGYHIDEKIPPLPKDLQDLMDSSPQGVVYFSMGSVIKSAELPEKTKKDLVKVMGELPYTVLWKFEENLKDLPKHVHIRSWMPQSSILAHPNVKLFITHGGMLSVLEALQNGVPLLAIPVFGDQPANADRAARSGYAKKVPYSPDMGEGLRTALKELLSNDRYYNRAKYLSKIFRKREVAPSKLISHYVELAIDTKGAYHLRSPSLQYTWYQRWMLDQALVAIAVLYILKKIICVLVNKACGKKDRKVKKN